MERIKEWGERALKPTVGYLLGLNLGLAFGQIPKESWGPMAIITTATVLVSLAILGRGALRLNTYSSFYLGILAGTATGFILSAVR